MVIHTLQGNVAGIPTTQNPDGPEGLESGLSIRIHRILAELSHSTEPELRNSIEPKWISAELPPLRYFEDSRQAGKSSGPQNLTSLSILQE
jgi:hypothetical protein